MRTVQSAEERIRLGWLWPEFAIEVFADDVADQNAPHPVEAVALPQALVVAQQFRHLANAERALPGCDIAA